MAYLEKYLIKDNLPEGIIKPYLTFARRSVALSRLLRVFTILNTKGYNVKLHLRDEKKKPLRGTIKVEIDGFYYYVELFKI